MPSQFGMAAWGLVVGVAMIKAGMSLPQSLGHDFVSLCRISAARRLTADGASYANLGDLRDGTDRQFAVLDYVGLDRAAIRSSSLV